MFDLEYFLALQVITGISKTGKKTVKKGKHAEEPMLINIGESRCD